MARSKRATAARRYAGALKAIRAKHATATHRDAQFVYRILKAKTGGAVLSGKQIAGARRSTTARALTEARNRGSRSRQVTPAEAGKLTKERNRGKAKTTGRAREGGAAGGAPEGPAFIGGGGGAAAPADDEDEGEEEDAADLEPDEWDDYEGDFEDFEIETSADYGEAD